jgi:maltose/moltooligosaccharide transporter
MMQPAQKPALSLAGLINISVGFFGIQIGFALQNANMSRVFQTLGARMDDLPALWIAAPLTGLIVQPLVGYWSDRTWTRLGRRRPYFLVGAILSALALAAMPLAPAVAAPLLLASVLLWLLDASLNIATEPFRAFVGDMLRPEQHAAGYAMQTAFIGAGAVFGSILPWLLEQMGAANTAAAGQLPDTLRFSFWTGAAALLAAVLWTVLSTREFDPNSIAAFSPEVPVAHGTASCPLAAMSYGRPALWLMVGALLLALIGPLDLEREIAFLAILLGLYGCLTAFAIRLARVGRTAGVLTGIVGDFAGMPPVMKRLALVQFFSWSAFFIMWINTTPVVAQYAFGSTDPASAAYNDGASWVNVLFTVYNGVAGLAALVLLPACARRIGVAATHALCLCLGAAGFLGFFVLRDPMALLLCEVGIGIAWASILSMPYAILASNLPQAKLGTYMGLFNVFIVVPQLVVATATGSLMQAFFPGQPIWTMLFAAISTLAAAIAMIPVARMIPKRA